MSTTQGYALGPGWKGILASAGVRHQDVLRHAGLPEDLLGREDNRVPAGQFLAFARSIEELVGDPDFMVRLTELMSPEWFAPPVFAALCSPNLNVAARRLAKFKPLMAPIELKAENLPGGRLQLRYRWLSPTVVVPSSLHGAEALFIVRLARIGTRERISPVSVTVPELPPAQGSYELYLGTRMRRGDPLEVVFSREDAERPFLTENHAMWNIFEPQLRQRLADLEGGASFEERTCAILLEALPSGVGSVEEVARRLAVSSRTLQRRLKDEGTTFKTLVHRTREQLARHYLSQTRFSVSEIAYLVGFEEPTSFSRAFHQWTGQTPDALRRSQPRAV